ncbi:helix-turn-helix domain-containing protein [Mariniflexile sp. HNIBRBA6329]|uniref:helix-turn-helix domain-containing protein n=1 Tax=Mariniflexile sp. HNIBRBA6329 TaxID=3373088 RepID=UPI0037463377
MAIDVYKHFLKHPRYNKLVGSDYLLVEYKCPIEVEKFKLWTQTPFITYVISGQKDWTSLNKTYTIKKGEALFINKGVYNTKQYFEVDYCVMLFFITQDFIKRFVEKHKDIFRSKGLGISNCQIFKIDVGDTLNSLFLSVFNYLNQGNNIPKELVEMKFNELLFNITLNPANKDLVQFFNSLHSTQRTSLNDIMMKNFHSDLKLKEYARLYGKSLSSFKRDFQEFYNNTPRKWLNNKRLEYAKTLLENPELNINDICFESGFKNPSHFNSSFKNMYNLPPNQYRKLYYNL